MSTKTQEIPQKSSEKPIKRQLVSFLFYRLLPSFKALNFSEKKKIKREALGAIKRFNGRVMTYGYSLVGIRADCDFMLWRIAFSLDDLQKQAQAFLSTPMGQFIAPAYAFLSQTRRSIYVDKIHPEHQEERLQVVPGNGKYLFVYPFVKKREWYRLSLEERQRMMDEHIRIGAKYRSVKLHTTYSFGLDDQEFVVAFETDEPSDFLDLVMELRETEASLYTERDTPIFTCVAKPLEELFDSLT